MGIISEQVIIDTEAKEILEKREKETELKYEQKNALEILRKFITTDPEKVKKLVEELKKIEKLRDKNIVAIANFLPEDKDELRTVLHKDYTSLTEEEISLVLETIRKSI